jgi:hypothetical protein
MPHEPHDRAYLRKQRQRIIAKRKRIIEEVWNSKDNEFLKKPGKLAKYNLACSCWMCKEARKNGPDKIIEKIIQKEANDYEGN